MQFQKKITEILWERNKDISPIQVDMTLQNATQWMKTFRLRGIIMKFQNTEDKENILEISKEIYKQVINNNGMPELHEISKKQLLKQENKG